MVVVVRDLGESRRQDQWLVSPTQLLSSHAHEAVWNLLVASIGLRQLTAI